MPIQVRRLTPQDAETLSRMIIQNLRQVTIHEYSEDAVDLLVAHFTPSKLLEDSASQFTLVGVLDGNLVGTASLRQDRVRSVFVDAARHRCGIGKTLMLSLEAEARRRAIPKLTLMSAPSACAFYQKLGYSEMERIDRDVDGIPLPVIRMDKTFASVCSGSG